MIAINDHQLIFAVSAVEMWPSNNADLINSEVQMHVLLFPTWSCMSCSLLQIKLHRLFPCLNRSRTHLVAVCPVSALQGHQGRLRKLN